MFIVNLLYYKNEDIKLNNIYESCINNDLKNLKLLYENAIENVCVLDKQGNNILHIAVKNNNYEIVKYLLEKNLTFNVENTDCLLPIDIAILNKNYDLISLFIQSYSSKFISAIINTKPISKDIKDFIISMIDYDKSVYYPDYEFDYYKILNQSNYESCIFGKNQISLSENCLNTLKMFIFKENWSEVKNIIIQIYKTQNFEVFKKIVPFLITYLSIKEKDDLIKFLLEMFNIGNNEKFIFDEELLSDTFIYGNITSISYILNSVDTQSQFIKKNIEYFKRGSLNILKCWESKFNVILDKDFFKKIFLFSSSNEYAQYIKEKSGVNNYDIIELLVEIIFENDHYYNEKICDFISNNQDYLYVFNINNENILNRIIKSNNYYVIKYLIDNFKFLINHYNMNESYALFESLKFSNVEIFELIALHENTDINVFDDKLCNVLHNYAYNFSLIENAKDKFNIIISKINDEVLLLSNMNGETPLLSMAKLGLIEEIRILAVSGLINECNANYKVQDKSLLDMVNISVIEKYKQENLNNTVDLGSIEEYALSKNIIQLSRLLYLKKSDKNKRKDINNNVAILSLVNKSSDINIIKMFSFYGISVNGINAEEIETPLMKSIKNRDIDLALFLLNQKCEINTTVSGVNNLKIALEQDIEIIIFLLLRERIEVDLNILVDTKYNKWKFVIKEEKIDNFNYKREKYKESFFDKKEVFKYRINKNDTEDIKIKKNIRNIIDSSSNVIELIEKCNSYNIKIDFIYEKNHLSKIYFNNDISHESIGLTLSNIKEKINYNYFELKKIRGK